MEYHTFRASKIDQEISRVVLDDKEWVKFLKDLGRKGPRSIDTNNMVTSGDIEWMDTNRCVPLCNGKFVNAPTQLASVINGEIGDVFLRLWFGNNGMNTSLNRIGEAFTDLRKGLEKFLGWWSTVPTEPQVVGGMVVSKHMNEFGVGHLHVWIREGMLKDTKEPTQARERYIYHLRPWAFAYDFMHALLEEGLIESDKGKLSAKINRRNNAY